MATKFEQRLDELKRKYGSGGGEPKEAPAPSVTPTPSQPATGGVSDIQGRMFKRLGIAAPPSAPAPTVAPVTPAVQAPPVPADVQAFEEAPSLVQPMPEMPKYQPPAPVTPPLPATTPRYTGEAAGRLSALQQVTTEAPQRAKVDEQAAVDKFQKRREKVLKQFTSSPDVLLPAMMDMEILPQDFATIPVEQIPWQKLQQAPQFKEAAKIGETDPERGRQLIIAEMEKREQSPLRQALRGFTHGAVEQFSFGAATPIATSGTPVERGAEFTGSVVGQIPLAIGAGTIAGRVIPAAVTGPARAIAQGVGTGALLQTGREAVEAARAPGEFDLAKAAGRIGETAATYGAYMGIYSYLNPVVDNVVAAGAKRLGPAVQKAMESLPAEVVKGTVTGAAAGVGMGTLKAVAQGVRKEGFDLNAIGRAALEEAGQEASEEAVEAVALGIVSRLMGVKGPIDVTTTPTPAVTQPTTTEAPVAPQTPAEVLPKPSIRDQLKKAEAARPRFVQPENTVSTPPVTQQDTVQPAQKPKQETPVKVDAMTETRNELLGRLEQVKREMEQLSVQEDEFSDSPADLERAIATATEADLDEIAQTIDSMEYTIDNAGREQTRKPRMDTERKLGEVLSGLRTRYGEQEANLVRNGQKSSVIPAKDQMEVRNLKYALNEQGGGRNRFEGVRGPVPATNLESAAKRVYTVATDADDFAKRLYKRLAQDLDRAGEMSLPFDYAEAQASDSTGGTDYDNPRPLIKQVQAATRVLYSGGVADSAQETTTSSMPRSTVPEKAEPWQMTHREWVRSEIDPIVGRDNLDPEAEQYWRGQLENPSGDYDKKAHKAMVQRALAEGKDVSAAVLEEYPDLKRRQTMKAVPKQTQPTPTAQPTTKKALYREVEAEKALAFIPGANVVDAATTVSQRYETSPGATRGGGILLEFDGAGLQGNTTADGAFAGLNTQAAQQESLRAITVKADAQVSKRDKRRYDTILSRLESQGWTKTENADGSVTYRKGGDTQEETVRPTQTTSQPVQPTEQKPAKEKVDPKVEAARKAGITVNNVDELQERLTMFEDAISTKKAKDEKVPQEWLDKRAALADIIRGEMPQDGVASNLVFGHPQATSVGSGKYSNLIPIRTRNVASVERAIERFEKIYNPLAQEVAMAEYKAKQAKGSSKAAKDAREYVKSAEFTDKQSLVEMLRDETRPELNRLLSEVEKYQPSTPVKERLRAKVEAQEGTGLTDVRMGAIAPAMRPLITGGKQNIDVPALNPDIEARFQGAKQRPPGESPLSKAKETWNTVKRYATSDLPYLPGGQRYARLAFKLRQLSKGRGTASDQAALYLQGITTEMRRDEYNLFNRAVVYNDLLEDVNKGLYDINEELPFGFTADDLKQEHSRVMEMVGQSEPVQRALKDRKAVMKEVTETYADLYEKVNGKPPPFNREDYFHHEVLNRLGVAPGRVQGTGEQVKTQKAGWQKARKGTAYDFLTNYLEAEHKVLAEMLYGIKIHQLIDFVAQNEDISAKLKGQAKEMEAEATDDQRQRKVDWRKLVPEGYKLWQPNEGNFIFRANAIDAHLVDQMMEQGLEEIGVPRDKIRRVLAIGGRKMELAIPQEIADTLDHFGKSRPPAVYDTLDKGLRFAMTKWKRHQLLFLTRAFKYNVRNVSGDVDAVVSANPNALKKTGRAVTELHNFLINGGAPSADLEAWMERGGMQDVLGIAEDATQIDALKQFRRFSEQPSIKKQLEKGDLLGVIKQFQSKFSFVEKANNFREYILRYAAFMDYVEQIQRNDGVPDNWGASVREEVQALKDPYDMAYELSNDLLGAYDKVSVAGQFIRERFIPFWSWNEVNARRYKRIMENAFRDGVGTQELGKTIGRKLAGVAIKSPMIAYNLGKFAVKAHAVSALLAAWNYLRFRDEEDSLPETVRSKPHIIFGRDEDGKVVYFNRLGAVADFYEWFGLDASPQYVRDYLNGRMTMKEIAQDMVSSPVNKLVQGFGPTKTAFEWLSGKTTYPDFRKPRTIRDKREFLADSVGLGDAYRLAFGKPTRGAGEIVKNIFTYRVDPEEVAYSEIVGLKYEWLKKKKGMGDPGGPISPKSNALYYYKQALRYGDEEAADKYLAQYIEYGGTKKGLNQSLKTLDPFYGMSKAEKVQFLAQLTEREKAQLERANEFYRNVLSK